MTIPLSTAKAQQKVTRVFFLACRTRPPSKTVSDVPAFPLPDDERIYLLRAYGLRTSDRATIGAGLGGKLPPASDTHLIGLPFTDGVFLEFRLHGPRIRVDDLCAFHEGLVPRVFSDVLR